MQRIQLAPQGPEFSQIVMGFWRLHEWSMSTKQCVEFIEQCLDLGITTMDHASLYGNYGNPSCEQLFGEALKLQPSLKQRIQVVSKCGINLIPPGAPSHLVNHYDASPQSIIKSVDQSLQRMDLEQLDVLLIHRPDYLLYADEVAETFDRLHTQGKVEHFGVSNFNTHQFDLLNSKCAKPLVTNQLEISPFNLPLLDSGELEQCQRLNIRPMAWSCLAGGRLFDASNQITQRLFPVLQQIKQEIGAKSIDEVVYAWILALPCGALPIVGSGKIDRVKRAVDALSLQLDREQWARIWVAAAGHNLP